MPLYQSLSVSGVLNERSRFAVRCLLSITTLDEIEIFSWKGAPFQIRFDLFRQIMNRNLSHKRLHPLNHDNCRQSCAQHRYASSSRTQS